MTDGEAIGDDAMTRDRAMTRGGDRERATRGGERTRESERKF